MPALVGMVEGCSAKAQPTFERLVGLLLDDKPKIVFQSLFFGNHPEISTKRDREIAKKLDEEAQTRLGELSAVPHDYVCHTHQCLASWCGCLEDYLRTHCGCGTKLVSDCGQLVCPICGWPEPE